MTAVPGRLTVDRATGRLTGPASLEYNDPFPCVNGNYGSGAIQGVVMHTMVGNLPGTIAVFNNPSYQASAHFGIDQQGHIHQFGPIGKGWIAWAQVAGNQTWYSIEHADNGDPDNPLTDAQIAASAQVVECLSAFAGFPLQVTDSVAGKGYGVHSMGGVAWGGHTCVPFSTELLTPEGWRPITQVREGALVASWSPDTGEILFGPVLSVVPPRLQDTIIVGGFEMTADHGVWVRHARRREAGYSRINAGDAHARHELPLAGHYAGPGLPVSDDLLRLLVHIQADGHVMRSDHGQRLPKGIEFHYRKQRKIDAVTGLLRGLGIDFKQAEAADGTNRIRIYDAAWTQQVALRWLPGREYGWEWLALSPDQFAVFHDELLNADGCRSVNKYSTASQVSADVVMALHAIHGYRANRDAQGMVVFGRTASAGTEIPHVNARSSFGVSGRSQVPVTCVTTSHGTIMIRQGNRRVGIIGNCPDLPPKHVRSAQRADIIALAKQIRAAAMTPGHVAYRAYGNAVAWKNYQGLPMPHWDALTPLIRAAWEAAAAAVQAMP